MDHGLNPSVSLLVQDIPLPDVEFGLREATLVTAEEQAFLEEPWEGAKILIPQEASVREFLVLNIRPNSLRDLQHIAATYRELLKASSATSAGCVINFSVTPNLPGNLGPLFGYNALISVIQNGTHFEVRYNSYEMDEERPSFLCLDESAWESQIELKLGEPFEAFFNRLFFIED